MHLDNLEITIPKVHDTDLVDAIASLTTELIRSLTTMITRRRP
jgi:hypothetical protein